MADENDQGALIQVVEMMMQGGDGPSLFQTENGLSSRAPQDAEEMHSYRSQHVSDGLKGHGADLSKLPLGKAGSDKVLSSFMKPGDGPAAKANMRAFLDTIAYSEGTIGRYNNGYNELVGGKSFGDDYSQHPNQVVDLGRGLRSSAAGRYQFLHSTWAGLQNKLNLSDFSPNSQDAGALQLVKDSGALEAVKAGDFNTAINKTRGIWASFPGAGYGQHENQLAALHQVYTKAGGLEFGQEPSATVVAQNDNNAPKVANNPAGDATQLRAETAKAVTDANDAPKPGISTDPKKDQVIADNTNTPKAGNNNVDAKQVAKPAVTLAGIKPA